MIKSVYIHVPFCIKKCKYCSFCSFQLISKKEQYLKALLQEIKTCYKQEELRTIYFGGGTPSLLDAIDIKTILDCFNISKDCEITLEMNPNYYSKIEKFQKIGVNRFSMGVQTFDENILSDIGRSHKHDDITKAIIKFNESNIENYSIDLMYGLPNQTLKIWEKTLDKATEILPKHISIYGLKIEEGSYYNKTPPKNLPDDDLQAQMYELAIKKLSKDYLHYEFSNFALNKKYFSKHNLTYWNCEKYYGFGLSASGYTNEGRYTNTFNFKDYINSPTKKEYVALTTTQMIEEEIFLGLRVVDGINFEKINKKYNIDVYKKYKPIFEKFITYGFMKKTCVGIKLTQKGIMLSNEILCEFV